MSQITKFIGRKLIIIICSSIFFFFQFPKDFFSKKLVLVPKKIEKNHFSNKEDAIIGRNNRKK